VSEWRVRTLGRRVHVSRPHFPCPSIWRLRGRFVAEHADLISSAQGMPAEDVFETELIGHHIGGVPLLFE
jgi:hypothetical protein